MLTQRTGFYFGGFTSLSVFWVLVKIDQEMRPWECAQTDRRTDANRFYNLSHAICYSCGADNKKRLKHLKTIVCGSVVRWNWARFWLLAGSAFSNGIVDVVNSVTKLSSRSGFTGLSSFWFSSTLPYSQRSTTDNRSGSTTFKVRLCTV